MQSSLSRREEAGDLHSNKLVRVTTLALNMGLVIQPMKQISVMNRYGQLLEVSLGQ